MKFGAFLRDCREKSHLTQEELVEALYLYDDRLFHGLDTTTLSKWERSVTRPKAEKQLKILRFFQENHHAIFPCLLALTRPQSETLLCKQSIKNLIIGKRKELVLNFPSHMMHLEDLEVDHIRYLERKHTFLEIASDIRNSVHPAYTCIDPKKLEEWSMHPSNLFYTCQYKGFLIGFFFILRLTKEAQQRLLHFQTSFNELTDDDFCSYEESGEHIITHFFAWNDKAATMLMVRYYAHLIANQSRINSIGATVFYEEGKKILSNMNLKPIDRLYSREREVISYYETLENVLLNETVIKMLFKKDECPEE